MHTTTDDNVTTHQGSRAHSTESRTASKTAKVIASVRNWARGLDDQLHRG